jgi:hypothetical protein
LLSIPFSWLAELLSPLGSYLPCDLVLHRAGALTEAMILTCPPGTPYRSGP